MKPIEKFVETLIDNGHSYEAIYEAIVKHAHAVNCELIRNRSATLANFEAVQQRHAEAVLQSMSREEMR